MNQHDDAIQGAFDATIHYLQALESKGQSHVLLDENARAALRGFYKEAFLQKKRPAPIRHVPSPLEKKPRPKKDAPSPELSISLEGDSVSEKLQSLCQSILAIPPLDSLRQTVVFSEGNYRAKLLLVGEAPGFYEEKEGRPFVGAAGKKLDAILQAMGLSREQTYLANVVKKRPAIPGQITNNRAPTPEEIAMYLPFLQKEIELINPKVIIAFGRTAACALLGGDASVERMRGSFYPYKQAQLRVTYHPSYILHNDQTSQKRKLWEDMLAVMEYLKMPISEKQRHYFMH